MKAKLLLSLLTVLYNEFLRDLVVKGVDDPESEADNFLLSLLDYIFRPA